MKAKLGGRIRLIVSGGAPLSPEVEEFLRVTTCAFMLQGYGKYYKSINMCRQCRFSYKWDETILLANVFILSAGVGTQGWQKPVDQSPLAFQMKCAWWALLDLWVYIMRSDWRRFQRWATIHSAVLLVARFVWEGRLCLLGTTKILNWQENPWKMDGFIQVKYQSQSNGSILQFMF